jgi:NAD(P)-dependent dehydrogenase (short-subunit alcohol dehydrogenase family)
MLKKIAIFGSEGKIGNCITKHLSRKFKIIALDVSKQSKNKYKDVTYYNIDGKFNVLLDIYNKHNFYAVIHCQQFKNKNFLKTDLFNLNFQDYEDTLSSNLTLTLKSIILYLKSLRRNQIGRVINFASVYSIRSSNPELYKKTEYENPIYYTISKAGIFGLTKYLASYFKKYKILCNSISPHGVFNKHSKTFQKNFSQRSPIGRMSLPQEILPAIDFLLDEKNRYTNGIELLVDGGWTSC